jgi:hypothetical protein
VQSRLVRLDEIFPGAGANITNLSRFSDWERWQYDWHLDVEPTPLAITQRNGPDFLPGSLVYFDKPIADTHRGRMAGVPAAGGPLAWRCHPRQHLTPEEIRAEIAEGFAEGRETRADGRNVGLAAERISLWRDFNNGL